jgi:PKD repeat protein
MRWNGNHSSALTSIGILMMVAMGMALIVAPATGYTTEVTVKRFSVDEITPINETTVDYHWMEANLPVYGDGTTYYYFQGPIFEAEWEANYGVTYPEYRTDWGGSPPPWNQSEERWDRYWNGTGYDQMEETNWQGKNLGKLKGTNIADLCDLVGGLPSGKEARVIAADNAEQRVPYSALYTPTPQLGPYVLTWYSVDAGESGATRGYTGPDYTNGMRATFFADTSRNSEGAYVAGLGDQAEGLSPAYWYYYNGILPSMGGWTVKYVNRVYVYTNDPVPPPEADFTASIKSGRVVNGNFETGVLTPWTGSGASIYNGTSGTLKRGAASVSLIGPASGDAYIQQTVDLSGVGIIGFWRRGYGSTGKYLQVLVDNTVIANYTEAVTITQTELIDLSSYGFSGSHTLTFRAVNTLTSGIFTVYLDDIEDFAPGTSGPAPLTIQFEDHSTKMEDAAHTSWSWDFGDTATSIERNPLHVYTTPGLYTVTLTATNAGGSDTESRTGYIGVGNPPVAAFMANVTSGLAPLAVQFTDLSTGDGISSRAWDVNNDGTPDYTSPNPVHTYSSPGLYSVRLAVTGIGGSDEEVKVNYITVSEAPAPVAQFIANVTSGIQPLAVQFTDQSTGTGITSWSWDFGDGATDTAQHPVHTYTTAGTYPVTLTVTAGSLSGTEAQLDYIHVYPRGDLTLDDDVTWSDVILCAYMSWGLVDPDPAADFTGDGSVTWNDVVKLAYFQWGLSTEL